MSKINPYSYLSEYFLFIIIQGTDEILVIHSTVVFLSNMRQGAIHFDPVSNIIWISNKLFLKIRCRISCMLFGRGSDVETAWKMPLKCDTK